MPNAQQTSSNTQRSPKRSNKSPRKSFQHAIEPLIPSFDYQEPEDAYVAEPWSPWDRLQPLITSDESPPASQVKVANPLVEPLPLPPLDSGGSSDSSTCPTTPINPIPFTKPTPPHNQPNHHKHTKANKRPQAKESAKQDQHQQPVKPSSATSPPKKDPPVSTNRKPETYKSHPEEIAPSSAKSPHQVGRVQRSHPAEARPSSHRGVPPHRQYEKIDALGPSNAYPTWQLKSKYLWDERWRLRRGRAELKGVENGKGQSQASGKSSGCDGKEQPMAKGKQEVNSKQESPKEVTEKAGGKGKKAKGKRKGKNKAKTNEGGTGQAKLNEPDSVSGQQGQ